MYDYAEVELSLLSCFWLNPKLLEETKLEEKHFIHYKRLFVLFQSFYKKFGNLNIESVCNVVKDQYKLMRYIKDVIEKEPLPNRFEMYQSLLLELYNESKEEKYLREKTFQLANDFYLKNINSKEFKERFDNLYTHAKEICKNNWLKINIMLILKHKEMNEMKTKEIMGFVIVGIALVGILLYGADRVEKIENGEMTLVSQSQMDR